MCIARDPDRIPIGYDQALEAQRSLVQLRLKGNIPDVLWLLEHPPTITWGASGGLDHLLLGVDALEASGIRVRKADRGGDVTYHEPGQLVGYPIISLDRPGGRDLHAYLRALEEGIIRYLATLGIAAGRVPGRTGVWIAGEPARKVAAMGVGARRWVTFHGLALNVDNPLSGFERIVPCGIRDAAVTSIAREVGAAPPWGEVCDGLHRALEESLGRPLRLVNGRQGTEMAAR